MAGNIRQSLMNISATIRELMNTMKYSKKSDSTEYKLYLKLVLLGVAVVGGVAFVIHLIATIISNFLAPSSLAVIAVLFGLVA
jgi:protein translocase SEC61 complex gamma subunit